MLLNCTRLSSVWTSLRVSQLRRSATNTFYNNPCQLATKRIFSGPVTIILTRRAIHTVIANKSVSHSGSMLKHQRLLESIRWTRMQFARWRNRNAAERENNASGSGSSAGGSRGRNVNPSEQQQQKPRVKIGKSDFVRLVELSKSEKYVLLAAMGCLLVSSIITMSVPWALGRVIDIIFTKSDSDPKGIERLSVFSLILMVVFIIGSFANYGRVYLFNSAALRIIRNLRSRVYRTMLLQETSWFDTKGTGELINRLVNDTFFVGNSLSQNLSDGFRSLALISVGTGMMIYTSPQLALVSSLVVPVMAGVAIVYGRYVRRVTRELLDKFAGISKYAEERFGNVKTVKVFCRENEEIALYDKQLNDAMSIGYKEVRAKSIFFGLVGFSGNIIILSVLYYGGTLVMQQSLTIGELTAFMLYAGYVAVSMNGLSNFYSELNKGVGAAQRLWEILDREYKIPIDVGIVPLQKPIGEVQFDKVGFSFPSRPDTLVLNDFSLTLLPGQTTAVVGRSGSGKTTIANLLLRLYDPQLGVVLLDGQDLRALNPHWLRSHVSAVSQEPVLFSGTIRENIVYGLNPGTTVSEELLQEVVREAHVDEFTSQLPDGLETLVGQRGMMLSGGQKQRVAIARALIRNPTILILDEATSALDSMSEQLVQTALDRMVRGRTVLTIAHRLSTIRNADKIAVVDNGRVVEEGTYDTLMLNSEGVFRELVAKQAFIQETT